MFTEAKQAITKSNKDNPISQEIMDWLVEQGNAIKATLPDGRQVSASRWTKYGKDRIYVNVGGNAEFYIDLKTGARIWCANKPQAELSKILDALWEIPAADGDADHVASIDEVEVERAEAKYLRNRTEEQRAIDTLNNFTGGSLTRWEFDYEWSPAPDELATWLAPLEAPGGARIHLWSDESGNISGEVPMRLGNGEWALLKRIPLTAEEITEVVMTVQAVVTGSVV